MVRAAALVSGDGAKLQAILDSMYFKEIPDFVDYEISSKYVADIVKGTVEIQK